MIKPLLGEWFLLVDANRCLYFGLLYSLHRLKKIVFMLIKDMSDNIAKNIALSSFFLTVDIQCMSLSYGLIVDIIEF